MSTGSTSKGAVGRMLRRLGLVAFVGGALAVALALVTTVSALNPFATTTKERPDAVVLARVQDLARFDAATGRFETIVDQETDTKLPSWAAGERVVLDAQGDVTASVDLSKLPADAIELSTDGTHATVHVPEPMLDEPRLDPDTTRVVARSRGVLNRVGDAVTGADPVDDQALYQRAADKLTEAAAQSDLRDRARSNTEAFLEQTLAAAGVTDVTVVFDAAPADQVA